MKPKAIITIVQNGNKFLPIWYRYYSRDFAPEDIYIIDYGTNDGSLDGIKANVISIAGYSIEIVPQGNSLINELKSELLKKYQYVVYADYDELIYCSDGWGQLLATNQPYYTTQGYEIVQNRDKEEILDWSKPILSQRSYWYRCPMYDKSLITRIDFTWAMGNHSVSKVKVIEKYKGDKIVSRREENVVLKPQYVSGLLLLHLHKVDYKHAKALHHANTTRRETATVGGFHNFYDDAKFEQWYKDAEIQLSKLTIDRDTQI